MADSLEALFDQLQLHLTTDLLKRIKRGEATAAELNVARQLLKDNHIDAPKTDPHLAALAAAAAHNDEDDINASPYH